MQETVRFRPEIVAWWGRLMAAGGSLRRVHLWSAGGRGHGRLSPGFEQHRTVTMVLCLAGALRIEDGRSRLDLAAGDALVIRPGAWHRHLPHRLGALSYAQGVIAGRSDFFLEDHALRIVATWPEQPARALLEAVAAEDDEDGRRPRLRALLDQLAGETAEPIPTTNPAARAMEYALWENLHLPDAQARIVRASGLSRAQAYRIFSERFGRGISTVLREERLALGRELLATGLGVAEVAERCGIPDRAVFARAFRRRWGTPPSRLTGGVVCPPQGGA